LRIGPCQRQARDPCRAAREENPATFGQSRAGGANIVNEEKMLSKNFPGRRGKGEGILQVMPPRIAGQLGLGRSWAVTNEDVTMDPVPSLRKKQPRQKQRLIQAAPPQAADMQRHRNNHVGSGTIGKVAASRDSGQRRQHRAVSGVFEAVNQAGDRLIIQAKRTARPRVGIIADAVVITVGYHAVTGGTQGHGGRPAADAATLRQQQS